VVNRSIATGNSTHGFLAMGTAVGAAVLNLESSVSSNNGLNGVRSFQAGAVVRISNMIISGNQNGLSSNAAAIISFGNNSVSGNTVDGSPTSTIPQI
jgi:hypothetical protein